jgi:lambda repressor-like predicted transcriptional regulator
MRANRHEIRRMRRDGWTVKEIAKHVGLATTTVYNNLAPLPDRTPRPKPTARAVIGVVAAIANLKPDHILAKGTRYPALVEARCVIARLLIQDFDYSQSDVARAIGAHPASVWAMTRKWEHPRLNELFRGARVVLREGSPPVTWTPQNNSCRVSSLGVEE